MSRRDVVTGAAAVAAGLAAGRHEARAQSAPIAGPRLGPGEAFSYEALKRHAQQLATEPYVPPRIVRPDILDKLKFELHQQLVYRPDMTIALDKAGAFPMRLFHLGYYFKEPVRIHVLEGGQEGAVAREVIYSSRLFDSPPGNPARELPDDIGFAGFRIMTPGIESDWLSALGASYFRSSAPFDQYGLSARGLALNAGLPRPEEFPRFSNFWLGADEALTIYALLESPDVTGAYRIRAVRQTKPQNMHPVVMEIEATLHARNDVERLGIAPFSSMFWYAEDGARRGDDWRPEVHDSDGLAILTGRGERIWRPLVDPPRTTTSTFADNGVKGFGLLQRDRNPDHYLDDGVFYEKRPSVWVEPAGDWGAGALNLLEITTDDEIQDNIALYWVPAEPFRAGNSRSLDYRLSWIDDIPFPDSLARVTGTRTGKGGRPGLPRPPGLRKVVIDFEGVAFAGLKRDSGVEIVASASRGTISASYCHPVVGQTNRWRAFFDIDASGSDPVDLRAYLRLNDRALTETWIYQLWPPVAA